MLEGSRSDNVTLPPNVAFTGPTLNTTVAVISVGDDISRFWQPGMHCFSTSGSLSAAHTFSFAAGIRWLSFICTAGFSSNVGVGVGALPSPALHRDLRQNRHRDFFRRDGAEGEAGGRLGAGGAG